MTTNSQITRIENLIVYGIEECPKGMPKHAWLQSDLGHVVSVLSVVDTSIDSQSIKDCYHLGKLLPIKVFPHQF